MNQKGFVNIALIVLLVVVLGGGIGYVILTRTQETTPTSEQSPTPSPITDQTPAMQNPPTTPVDKTSWKTYRSEKYGFEFRYPEKITPLDTLNLPELNRNTKLTFNNPDSILQSKKVKTTGFPNHYEIATGLYGGRLIDIKNPVTSECLDGGRGDIHEPISVYMGNVDDVFASITTHDEIFTMHDFFGIFDGPSLFLKKHPSDNNKILREYLSERTPIAMNKNDFFSFVHDTFRSGAKLAYPWAKEVKLSSGTQAYRGVASPGDIPGDVILAFNDDKHSWVILENIITFEVCAYNDLANLELAKKYSAEIFREIHESLNVVK